MFLTPLCWIPTNLNLKMSLAQANDLFISKLACWVKVCAIVRSNSSWVGDWTPQWQCCSTCLQFVCFRNCYSKRIDIRRIYIANFAIFKIATSWSYHLHLREKSRSFSFTKLRDFLVGSAHVRSQATVHAFMHAAHAVCMRAEDIDRRFKERA